MKAVLIGNKGSSTLEILIAFAIFTITFAGIIILVFGSQTSALYARLNNEALYKTTRVLEDARRTAQQNFLSLISDVTPTPEDIYQKMLTVTDLTTCRKHATSTFTWQVDFGRPQYVSLGTDFVDIVGAAAQGSDCVDSPPDGTWTNPLTFASRDIVPPGSPASDIDVAGKIIYLTGGLTGPTSRSDFFILDARNMIFGNGNSIVIRSDISTGDGLMAVDVASTSPTKAYAFVANDEDATTNQLQVIDVSNISLPVLAAQATLPNVTGSCPSACPGGRSINYYNNTVYMGIHYIVGPVNKEFHVYDVSTPTTPAWRGSYNVDHNVNKISVRDQMIGGLPKRIAYLATSADDKELIVLDVTSPGSISELGSYNADGDEDARSLYVIGNKLYLGRDRTPSGRPDFLVIDISTPGSPTLLGSKQLGLNSGAFVSGIRVSDRFGFLALNDPNDGFQVYNVSNPGSMSRISTFNFSQKTTGIDFDGTYVYTSNESNDALRVIYQTQCTDGVDNEMDGKIDTLDPQCHSDGNANNPASYQANDNDEAS